jgi:polyhydroxyalkanoate synthesis repressor PhaR
VGPPLVVKKYANRRLYDTEESRYITTAELSARVRAGRDVRVLDAKTDEDLTQPTLVQLLVEGNRAHLLPVPLLLQLVRLGDDALAEFYGRYMTWALEVYFSVKQRAASSINPFAQMPFDVGGALARMFMSGGQSAERNVPAWTPPPSPTPPPEAPSNPSELADLRRELEQIKRSLVKAPSKKPRKSR